MSTFDQHGEQYLTAMAIAFDYLGKGFTTWVVE